jgi:hypothetical protein
VFDNFITDRTRQAKNTLNTMQYTLSARLTTPLRKVKKELHLAKERKLIPTKTSVFNLLHDYINTLKGIIKSLLRQVGLWVLHRQKLKRLVIIFINFIPGLSYRLRQIITPLKSEFVSSYTVSTYFTKRVQQKTEIKLDVAYCNFAYNENHDVVIREYYLYFIKLFKSAVSKLDLHYNFIFGNYSFDFSNNAPTLIIDTQHEHTLVKPGGRDSIGSPKGNIRFDDDFYLVRIASYDYLKNLDIVVEYSLPNINNIKQSGLFNSYLDKVIYIAPMIYDLTVLKYEEEKKYPCITLFGNPDEPKRKIFLDQLLENNILSTNITNCFEKNELRELYLNTKILLNIRQTLHHDTLEELRILPALLNGVIIISEDVPLRNTVPYNEFIIFSDYNSIIDKIKFVQDNYKEIWEHIFLSQNYLSLMNDLEKSNEDNILNFLTKLVKE